MNLEIELLANCPEHIPKLAQLWFNEIGKQWIPNATVSDAEETYEEHCNRNQLPLTFVAICEDEPIGMASLRENDGIRSDLSPWLGSLIVHPNFRNRGVAKMLMDVTRECAKTFGYQRMYLFTLDQSLPDWYERLGWKLIGMDQLYHHPVIVMEFAL